MKANNGIFCILFLLSHALLACGSDEGESDKESTGELKVSCNTSLDVISTVGLYMVYDSQLLNSGNHLDNVALRKTDNHWTSSQPVSWADASHSATFYAYSPYLNAITDVGALPFATDTDQSTADRQQASNFLWGKVSAHPPMSEVDIPLRRLFSTIAVVVEAGENVSSEELRSNPPQVCINDVQVKATINLSNGTVTPTGNTSAIIPLLTDAKELTFTAIVIPQHIASNTFVSISWDGQTTALPLTAELQASQTRTVTARLSRQQGSLNIGISQWETTDKDFGGTVN